MSSDEGGDSEPQLGGGGDDQLSTTVTLGSAVPTQHPQQGPSPYQQNGALSFLHEYQPIKHQQNGHLSPAKYSPSALSSERLYPANGNHHPGMSKSMSASYHESSKTSNDLSSRAPPIDNSHTSKVRLETYYRLSWEDDEAKKRTIFSETNTDGSSDGDGSRRMQDEEELATKMLQIQSKRFYLDVKQNWRGRFIKIAEVGVVVGAGGRKSRLVMSMGAATEFRDHLNDFGEFYAQLGPQQAGNVQEDGQLKSEVMMRENRRYYIDLKENSRGRFLRVTQTATRNAPGAGQRSQIALPAQGIIEVRDALTELLNTWADDASLGFQGELPEAKQIRVENKIFYFDIGQNSRGVFMRISEVKNNFRTAVTIPERSWSRFRDIFVEACDKMAAQQPGPNTSTSTASTEPAGKSAVADE